MTVVEYRMTVIHGMLGFCPNMHRILFILRSSNRKDTSRKSHVQVLSEIQIVLGSDMWLGRLPSCRSAIVALLESGLPNQEVPFLAPDRV
jgi:hypothetical protein